MNKKIFERVLWLLMLSLLPNFAAAGFPYFQPPVLIFEKVSACQPEPCQPGRDAEIVWGTDVTSDFLHTSVADMDSDGREDLVGIFLGYRDENGVDHGFPLRVFIQDDGGQLIDKTFELFASPVPEPRLGKRILLDDFNGDGMKDIFVCNHGLELDPDVDDWVEQDTLVLSRPDGKFEDKSDTLPGGAFYSHGCASGDLDNDGDIDLVVSAEWRVPGVGGLRVYINDGAGRFQHRPEFSPRDTHSDSNAYTAWLELLDTNQDGFLDLYKGRTFNDVDPRENYVVLNDGTGSFRDAASRYPVPSSPRFRPREFDYPGYSRVVDLNGDGRKDLALVSYGGLGVSDLLLQLLISDGSGRLIDETNSRLPAQTLNTGTADWFGVHFTDIDDDGDIDIVRDDQLHRPDRQQIFLNDGGGRFQWLEGGMRWYSTHQPLLNTRAALDLGNDGDIDFVGTGCTPNGCGQVVYEAIKPYPSNGVPWARIASIQDVDGNGYDEVAVGLVNKKGQVRVHVRDPADKTLISKAKFSDGSIRPLEMIATPGIDGSADGIAVLGINKRGHSVVKISRASDGQLISKVPFLNAGWTPKGLIYFQMGQTERKPTLGLLTHGRGEQIVVQLREAITSEKIRNITFLNRKWYPIQVAAVTNYDTDGRDAIAVLARNALDQTIVQVRDAESSKFIKNLSLFNANFTPMAMTVLPGDEQALGKNLAVVAASLIYSRRTRIDVLDILTGSQLERHVPYRGDTDAVAFASHKSELILLSQNRDASTIAEVFHRAGDKTRTSFLSRKWTPLGVTRVDYAGDASGSYLATLAVTIDGALVAEIRASETGSVLSRIKFR